MIWPLDPAAHHRRRPAPLALLTDATLQALRRAVAVTPIRPTVLQYHSFDEITLAIVDIRHLPITGEPSHLSLAWPEPLNTLLSSNVPRNHIHRPPTEQEALLILKDIS